MSRRHHRERHAMITLWRPVHGPQVPDENRRAEALRRWRGQDEDAEEADKADEDKQGEQ